MPKECSILSKSNIFEIFNIAAAIDRFVSTVWPKCTFCNKRFALYLLNYRSEGQIGGMGETGSPSTTIMLIMTLDLKARLGGENRKKLLNHHNSLCHCGQPKIPRV